MAAILPFLERQLDPAETEEQSDALTMTPVQTLAGLHGLGRTGAEALFEASLDPEALDQAHSQLVFTAWQRDAVLEALAKTNFRVQARNRHGKVPGKVFLVLDRPIGELIPEGSMNWSPPTDGAIHQFELLSWTSKMGAPSFSLPAGSGAIRGACPGSAAGQSVNGLTQIRASAQQVHAKTGLPVHLDRAICQHCYAEGGQYATANVQFAQVLRHAWAQRAVADGTFVETMQYAIANANFKLKRGWYEVTKTDKETGVQTKVPKWFEGERHSGRYFRLHDSGDFYSAAYLAAWVEVARLFPDILFWAPTRIWATAWGSRAVAELLGHPDSPRNLIVRPSAFHVNEPPPDLSREPGWAAGTTVYSDASSDGGPSPKAVGWEGRDFDWDCGVYALTDKQAACRNAIAPDGKRGCRACWRQVEQIVNYTLH